MTSEEIDIKAVGKRIYWIRKHLGLTQEEFGEMIFKAGKSNVSKWEKGISLPSNKRVMLIAEKAGITLKELMIGDQPQMSVEEIIEHIQEKIAQNKAMIEIGTDSHKEEIIAEALEELLNELQAQ